MTAQQPDQSQPAFGTRNQGPQGSLYYLALICFVATLGGLLFGYDTAVIAGAIGFLKSHFNLSAAAQGWVASSALLGCVIGVLIAGVTSDLLGRRRVLVLCALLFVISAIGTAVPQNQWVFVIFRMIGGVGVGAASMTSPLYIAEVSPARIRGLMVSLNQLAIVFGMLAVYFVNYAITCAGDLQWNIDYGWRWMFASETIPAVALLGLLMFVPESPRWLVKKNRGVDAWKVLSRIVGNKTAQKEILAIKGALQRESTGVSLFLSRRVQFALFIGIVLAVFQQVTGINVFLYYAPEIFKAIAGSQTDVAMLQTIVVGAVNMLFTLVAIMTVDLLGRKPLMVLGYMGMAISLGALGAAAYYDRTETWLLGFILSYIACFALSVGPVTWVILSEIYPIKIRGVAMSVATVCLWAANFVVSQTFPMMDDNEWLVEKFHHAFPFWLYGILCIAAALFVIGFIPETKGRSLEEIERRWTEGR
jgi:SP family xylose:H+ symportor-like MFS transporter